MDDRVLAAVVATGLVVSNRVTVGELSKVAINDTVTLKFLADPNSAFEPEDADRTRLNSRQSYKIENASFALQFAKSGVSVPMFMGGGSAPYFTIYKGNPKSDGFFVSTSTVSPGGVPLALTPPSTPAPGAFHGNLDLSYEGNKTVPSTDLLAAAGRTYAFDGLTRFSFDVWNAFPDNEAMGFDFESMRISTSKADQPSGE